MTPDEIERWERRVQDGTLMRCDWAEEPCNRPVDKRLGNGQYAEMGEGYCKEHYAEGVRRGMWS